jgi:polysaccharide pyruvyl transferase WcaK-like protein
VVGFFGHGNYGDELFLDVFREHLGHDVRLRTILGPDGGSLAGRLGAGIRASDAILIGGGDLVKPWSLASRYWEMPYLRRPVFIAGVGVPTWGSPDPAIVAELRRFFRAPNVRFIGVRDGESLEWIAANLQPEVPVRLAPDLVCGLTLPPVERPAGQPVFGVAVRSRGEPDDLTHVRRLCERAAGLGYRVRRIVLGTGRVGAADAVASEGLGLPETELVRTDDLAAISRAIGECSVLATMKFHGVVVATMYGVPSIALMPTAKTRTFLRGIERPDLLSVYSDPDLPSRLVPDLAPIAPATIARLRADAIAHLAELRTSIKAATAS